MKKFTQSLMVVPVLMIVIASHALFAQQRPGLQQGRERLEVAKTTFLSRQMKLTPEEARLFWPVYDQYQEALSQLKDERLEAFQSIAEGLENKSDQEINAMIDERLLHAEKALAARKKLVRDLREFLPPIKIAVFFRAEQQFNRELQQRMIERRNGRRPPGPDH
ncbi:MAG: hypothetical protein IH597_06500 [Bacteroidales bacterium]|nr:hypothetical protein [Bacteroidales bacterium]